VLDGTDGVGKRTQTELLVSRMISEGYEVGMTDFPQYGERSAIMVEDYLAGKYGSADEVGPYVASLFYAADRFAASRMIEEALSTGRHVVSNRYTASNMGHQGGKIKDLEERKKYWRWLMELEFEIMKLPRPTLTIILRVPAEIAQTMALARGRQEYLLKKKPVDIHEAYVEHLKATEEAYLQLPQMFPDDFLLVECHEDNMVLPANEISDRIWKVVKPLLA
jgi:dTMP kinase